MKVLQNYALSKINIDRLNVGLNPVSLSDNKAAQHHASEILQSGFLSHWSTNGLKPYMLYSLYNGTGYVQQNTGQISYINTDDVMKGITSHSYCTSDSRLYCAPIDPFDAIDKLENSMMYNDSLCCYDGHKNNILDKFHTNVSIGIAFNEYYFVLVQNFENNFLRYNLSSENDEYSLEAKMLDPNKNLQLSHISFYSDNLPSTREYEQNKNKSNYTMGDPVLIISKPLEFYEQYVQPESYRIIEAENWDIHDESINISFELPDNLKLDNRMVTMIMYATNKTTNPSILNSDGKASPREIVPLASYIIHNKSVPGFD